MRRGNPRRGRVTFAVVVAMLLLGLTACRGPSTTAVSSPQPNILLFLADDHGQWACGPCGNAEIVTPNLTRLAASGLLIERATSPGPVCSPARASLLTGRLPSQHGIHDFISETAAFDRDWLADEVLLPELLQGAGFRTALVGKWHLAANSLRPYRGFDSWVSFNVQPEGWENQYLHRGVVHISDQGVPATVDGYQTEELVPMVFDFIDRGEPNVPFFILFAPTETHAPFEGYPERWVDRYRDSDFLDVPRGESGFLPVAGDHAIAPDQLGVMLTQYYAAVSHQDEQLGVILDGLESRGLLDNTLVIYTSDHGHMNGHHGLVGKANATIPQNLYEETIRVPMMLSWPSGLPFAGEVMDIPFDHCDLFQTVLDAAAVEVDPATRDRINSPGRSVLEFVRDPAIEWRSVQFTEHGNARLVSDGRYKLIRRYPPLHPLFGDEFFDLENDPRETTNRIDDPRYMDRISAMSDLLEAHFVRYTVPERSGIRVMEMPPLNGREPWRRLAARVSAQE